LTELNKKAGLQPTTAHNRLWRRSTYAQIASAWLQQQQISTCVIPGQPKKQGSYFIIYTPGQAFLFNTTEDPSKTLE